MNDSFILVWIGFWLDGWLDLLGIKLALARIGNDTAFKVTFVYSNNSVII